MNSQTDKFRLRQQAAEEARKKRAKGNQASSPENKEAKKKETNNKKVNDLSELGNIVDVSTSTETQQSNAGDTKMADNKDNDAKLIEEWKKENPETVKFMEETSCKAGFMVINGHVTLAGFPVDEFNKWKEKQVEKPDNEGGEKPVEEKGEEELQAANDNKENIGLEKKEGAEATNDAEWVKKMDTHWKGWCEDREDPKYIYERDAEQKEGYSFKYYKTNEDKTANKPAAEVHYKTESDVEIKTADGKPADYEFWKSFANAAKKNNQIVNFEKMGKVENKSRLYLACVLQGVDAKNANVDDMNFEEAFKSLSDEEKKIAQAKLGLDENGAKIAKDRIAELRKMVKNKHKTGVYKSDDKDFEKYQEGKAKARQDMKGYVRDFKDEAKTDEERKSAKESYDQAKAALIKKALEGKQK